MRAPHSVNSHSHESISLEEWTSIVSNSLAPRSRFDRLANWLNLAKQKIKREDVTETFQSNTSKDELKSIRILVALGISFWREKKIRQAPDFTSEDAKDFVIHAIWPLIIIQEFPEGWYDALQELSSPQLAMFVIQARKYNIRKKPLNSIMDTWDSLSPSVYRAGIINLLDDLGDPRRGKAAFSAISINMHIKSKEKMSLRAILLTIGGGLGLAAIHGLVGNRFDAAAMELWKVLTTSNLQQNGATDQGQQENMELEASIISNIAVEEEAQKWIESAFENI